MDNKVTISPPSQLLRSWLGREMGDPNNNVLFLHPLEHQVAGHGSGGLYTSPHHPHHLLKPLNTTEHQFYQEIQQNAPLPCTHSVCAEKWHPFLLSYTPKYHGTTKINNNDYLILQNAFFSSTLNPSPNPYNIADIKIGPITHDSKASKEKKVYELQKYSETKKAFGVSLCGMLLDGVKYGKDYGKSLDPVSFKKAVFNFCKSEKVATKILENLKILRDWFLENEGYRFIASSLLLGYCDEDNVVFKMIDFCHVERSEGVDSNYLTGLEGLISVFESMSFS